jgi:acyl-CoA synthetase (AMP-forming)/AMP-acid ligase II
VLAELLTARVAHQADAIALGVHGGASITFAEWDRRSDAMARGLSARAVRPGDRVVLVFDGRRWPDFAAAYAGVHKAGAVAVVVPIGWPAPSPADVVADCGAVAVLAGADVVQGAGVSPAWVATPAEVERWSRSDRVHVARPAADATVAELVYVARPLRRLQCVGRSHHDLAPAPDRTPAGRAGAGTLVHAFPVGTTAGIEALWFPLVACGRRAVSVPAFEPATFCAVVERERATSVGLSPSLAEMLLACAAPGRHDWSSVTEVLLGEGRARPSLLAGLAEAFPSASVLDSATSGWKADGPASAVDSLGTEEADGQADPVPVDAEAEDVDGDVEAVILAIWRRVLGREDIGAGGDFFELGGDELAIARVRSLIEDAFGAAPPVATLREATTVEAQAAAVRRDGPRPEDTGPTVAPVAFSQEGMLWHEQFAPGCQNLPPLARRYRGPLDVAALERALSDIVRRHQPLRTTFELRNGRPVQVVAPPAERALPVHDMTRLPAEEQRDQLDRALAEASRPLDLVAGPLFQPTLYRLGDDDHVLVLRTHHSVYDDWSVGVFRQELSTLYRAFAAGEEPSLEPPPVSFTDFTRAQRRLLAGVEGARQLTYWKRRLKGAPLALQLPIGDPDRPSGSPQPSAAPVTVELPPALCAGVRELARQQRSTLFMTLLAVFQVLLHRWTGHDDLLLSTVVANRNRRELEGLIGCFSKKILLRLTAPNDPIFSEVVAGARRVVLEALANQDLPFETVLQEALGAAAADHGLVPYPVVMFQGVAPEPAEVVLPGLTTTGFDTSATTRRLHFMARDQNPPASEQPVPWGAGLYSGTFLILSVVEDAERLSLVARGAFHRPAVQELLASFETLVADVVVRPERRVSELAVPPPAGIERRERVGPVVGLRGFSVDLGLIETASAGCPGTRELVLAVREVAGQERLVAYVVPDGTPPSLTELRVLLWRRLPGYAWPAAMVVVPDLSRDRRGGPDRAALPEPEARPPGQCPPEGAALAAAWAGALGVDRAEPEGNYWQSFSFLEAVAALARAGVPVDRRRVARNRTLRTLAVDLATGVGGS